MRKLRPRLATAFFVMCIGILTFAQDTPSTSASDSAGAEQQVKQLEQQIRSQVVKGDTSGLEQYLADDYLNVNPAGMGYTGWTCGLSR